MTRKQELQKRLKFLKDLKQELQEGHRNDLIPLNKAIHSVTQMLYREQ